MFKNFKNKKLPIAISIFMLIGLIVFILVTADFRLPNGSSDNYNVTIRPDDETVFLTIDCKILFTNENKDKISANMLEFLGEQGVIIEKKEFLLSDDDTVFTLLVKASRQNIIQMEYVGNPNINDAIYIKGINHLYEYDYGPLSGWVFKVNGEFSDFPSSTHVLSDKDHIEWVYTLDLGRDVGNDFEEN